MFSNKKGGLYKPIKFVRGEYSINPFGYMKNPKGEIMSGVKTQRAHTDTLNPLFSTTRKALSRSKILYAVWKGVKYESLDDYFIYVRPDKDSPLRSWQLGDHYKKIELVHKSKALRAAKEVKQQDKNPTQGKYTRQQILEIRDLYKKNWTIKRIAKKFGETTSNIGQIVRREIYKDVK